MKTKGSTLALAEGLYRGFLFAVIGYTAHRAGCKKAATFVAGVAFIEVVNGAKIYRYLKKVEDKL